MNLMLLKYDYLTKQLWREQEFYETIPRAVPVKIDDYIYYRRVDNPADSLTLYRFPVDELPNWQVDGHDVIGKDESPMQASAFSCNIPSYPQDPELDDKFDHARIEEIKKHNETFPEEEIFKLRDLTLFY